MVRSDEQDRVVGFKSSPEKSGGDPAYVNRKLGISHALAGGYVRLNMAH